MRFLSIFAPRQPDRDPDTSPEVEDGAERAARLFGIPAHHMTVQVRAGFKALMGEVDSLRLDVEQLKLDLAQAESAADHDALVPVYNRRAFMREAQRIVAMVRRHEIEASLIFFDLNDFKQINDEHSHAAGDAVLRAIGEVLIRQTRETDLVGRIGGDEFAVVLTHLPKTAAKLKADSLEAAIRSERILHDGERLKVSASIGVIPFNAKDSAETLLALADEQMFADKARKRGPGRSTGRPRS